MKTYEIYNGGSRLLTPLHTFEAASFHIVDNVYMFYDEKAEPTHAMAVSQGLFVKTVIK
jgi:hypothetical protein